MRSFHPRHLLPLCVSAAMLAFGGTSQAATITVIDPPDATESFATGINDGGVIAGYFYIDQEAQSFVRSPDGRFTTFTPAGASAINNKGWVAGDLGLGRGFIRKPNGHIIKFGDDKAYHGFAVTAINRYGTVCGSFEDDQDLQHGFVRTADGTFIVFDPSGAVRTFVTDINGSGVVVGSFYTGSTSYGFVRAADGTITVLDELSPIVPYSINADGMIVGQYGNYGNARGFIRNAAGKYKTFEISGTDVDDLTWMGINDKGVIAGSYDHDTGETSSGFVRARDGTITTFDVPNAYYTYVTGMNRDGTLVGFIYGSDGIYHAYVRTP
jgi:hypothetical protein